jgi:hypothetical protein
MPPFSGLGRFYAVRKLGLTPQALRSHRFAVGKAGPRSRVMVDFPAQQIQGAQNSQDSQFKTNFAPPQPRPPGFTQGRLDRRWLEDPDGNTFEVEYDGHNVAIG